MLRRISVLLLSALVMVALVANAALAAPPDNKGACDNAVNPDCAEEDKEQGSPNDPNDPNDPNANAWGSVASQLGSEGIMGDHSSDPVPRVPGNETPRDGLGNVARNDAGNEGTDPADDTGDHIADHACIAAATTVPGTEFQPDCAAKPGRSA